MLIYLADKTLLYDLPPLPLRPPILQVSLRDLLAIIDDNGPAQARLRTRRTLSKLYRQLAGLDGSSSRFLLAFAVFQQNLDDLPLSLSFIDGGLS